MGTTHVEVTVRNLADEARRWTGRFVVDTGEMASVVPKSVLEGIGLTPRRRQAFRLADGSEVESGVAVAELEFMGEITEVSVVFGADDAEPLLGCIALESANFMVDPESQTLRRLRLPRL